MSNDILIHTEAGVMTITLNRPERKNSITSAMYGAMADALDTAEADAAIRVVVLQGHETIFSAGNDIGDFLNKPPAGMDSPVFRFLRGIAAFPKPLLAAVCGPAVGVGTTLLLHCDLVYAGDNAAFSMPFVNLGLCPEAASSLLVPQMMGYHRAAEALLMGEPFMAEAALEVLLTGIYRVTGAAVPVVGGAAAADHSFDGTFVFHDGEVLADGAVAVWIGADRPLRVVSGHGWEAQGVPLLVTKVEGQVVHEIGGRPAIDVYRENFRFEDPLLESPDNAATGYHPAHSFGLIEPDGTQVIRGAFIGPDGEHRTFTPLPPFCAVQIVSANREELLDVSEQVVGDALAGTDGVEDPTVMLTFSCVARMDLLGERGGEEAVRLQRAAGDVSTFGFYTYGEFARTTSVAGYHTPPSPRSRCSAPP